MSARKLWRRFLSRCLRNRMAEELDEEMRLHTELRANRLREQGIDSQELSMPHSGSLETERC